MVGVHRVSCAEHTRRPFNIVRSSPQAANHAELILPYVDTVLRLVPLAKRRAALPDWSLGGRPHIHGGGVQCMARMLNTGGP